MSEQKQVVLHEDQLPFADENPDQPDLVLARLDDNPESPFQNPNLTLAQAFGILDDMFDQSLDTYGIETSHWVVGDSLKGALSPHILQHLTQYWLKQRGQDVPESTIEVQRLVFDVASRVLAQVATFSVHDSGYAELKLGYQMPASPLNAKEKESGRMERMLQKLQGIIKPKAVTLQDLEMMVRYMRCELIFRSRRSRRHDDAERQLSQKKRPEIEQLLWVINEQDEMAQQALLAEIENMDGIIYAVRKQESVSQTVLGTFHDVKLQLRPDPLSENEQIQAVLDTLPKGKIFGSDLFINVLILIRVYAEGIGKVKHPEKVFNAWVSSLPKVKLKMEMEVMNDTMGINQSGKRVEFKKEGLAISDTHYCSLHLKDVRQIGEKTMLTLKLYCKGGYGEKLKEISFPFNLELLTALDQTLVQENAKIYYSYNHGIGGVFEGDETWNLFQEYATDEEREILDRFMYLQRQIMTKPPEVDQLRSAIFEVHTRKEKIQSEQRNFELVREYWRMFDRNFQLIVDMGRNSEKEQMEEVASILDIAFSKGDLKKRSTQEAKEQVDKDLKHLQDVINLIQHEQGNAKRLPQVYKTMHQLANFIDKYGSEKTEKPQVVRLMARINQNMDMERIDDNILNSIVEEDQVELVDIQQGIEAEQSRFREFQQEFLAQRDLFDDVQTSADEREMKGIFVPSFGFLERTLKVENHRLSADGEKSCQGHLQQIRDLQSEIQAQKKNHDELQEAYSPQLERLEDIRSAIFDNENTDIVQPACTFFDDVFGRERPRVQDEEMTTGKECIERLEELFELIDQQKVWYDQLFSEWKGIDQLVEVERGKVDEFQTIVRPVVDTVEDYLLRNGKKRVSELGLSKAQDAMRIMRDFSQIVKVESAYHAEVRKRIVAARQEFDSKKHESGLIEGFTRLESLLEKGQGRISKQMRDDIFWGIDKVLHRKSSTEVATENGGFVIEIKDQRQVLDVVQNQSKLKAAAVTPESFEDHGKGMENFPVPDFVSGQYLLFPRAIGETVNQCWKVQEKVVREMPRQVGEIEGVYVIPDIHLLLYLIMQYKKDILQKSRGRTVRLRSSTMVPKKKVYQGDDPIVGEMYEVVLVGRDYDDIDPEGELEYGEIDISSGDQEDTQQMWGGVLEKEVLY